MTENVYRRASRDRRLWVRSEREGASSFFTEALGDPPSVYRERTVGRDGVVLRAWDPNRSKLGAALRNGWSGGVPDLGERWLYLGAATGTTASHLADLVGRTGAVYAVERSIRPFVRLRRVADRYPNLFPILADARNPFEYSGSVPAVDGVYADIAQPDQVDIAVRNATEFLKSHGRLLLVLKTASMGRGRSPQHHLAEAQGQLRTAFEVERALALEPFHRRHYLVSARPTRALWAEAVATAPVTSPAARRVGPRR